MRLTKIGYAILLHAALLGPLGMVGCGGGDSNGNPNPSHNPTPGSVAGSWDFTATVSSGHVDAVEAILAQDSGGNISGTGTVTASGPVGNVFQAFILGSPLSSATDLEVDHPGDTCGADDGTRNLTGTINSSNHVTLTFHDGGGQTTTVTGTLNPAGTPPFSGTFTVSAPGCGANGATGTVTGVPASSLSGTYSGISASDSTEAITVTVTQATNGSFTGSGTDSKAGAFTITGNAVGNAFSQTVTFTGANLSMFGYYDPQLGAKGSILLTSFEGANVTTCSDGLPSVNGSCLVAILAKQ